MILTSYRYYSFLGSRFTEHMSVMRTLLLYYVENKSQALFEIFLCFFEYSLKPPLISLFLILFLFVFRFYTSSFLFQRLLLWIISFYKEIPCERLLLNSPFDHLSLLSSSSKKEKLLPNDPEEASHK